MLVLKRDAGGEHSEDIPQNAQLVIFGENVVAVRRGGPRLVLVAALHDRGL